MLTSLLSSSAQFLYQWRYPLSVSCVVMGAAFPLTLSAPFIGLFSDAKKDYSWQPFNFQEKGAPGIFDAPEKIEEGAPLKDRRGLLLFIFHRYVAFLSDVHTQLSTKYEAFLDWMGYPSEVYDQPAQWKDNSQGLYVFIHGIHGHPSCWNAYKKAIESKNSQADVCLVRVKDGGDCRLEEANAPIFQLIKSYLEKHPNKPIAIVGTSRGAPIAASLELKLRDHVSKPKVYVATIAGAHRGLLMMSLLKTMGFGFLWFSQAAIDELSFESSCAKGLLEKQRNKLSVERKFRYYSTTEEFQIQPCTSALPQLFVEKAGSSERVCGERFYVHGTGHMSIVDRVRVHLLEDLFTWMKGNQV